MPTMPVGTFMSIQQRARRVLALLLFSIACPASLAAWSGAALADTPPARHYAIPMQTFLGAYLNGMYDNHYKAQAGFHIPAIMLFAPNGQMLAQAVDDTGLSALASKLNSHAASPTLSAQPTVSVYNGIIAKSASIPEKSLSAPNTGQWTVIAILSDNKACVSCQKFRDALAGMRAANPSQLHVINVVLTQ